MDSNIREIYIRLLTKKDWVKCSSGHTVDRGHLMEIHLKWTTRPTNFASAMSHYHFPERSNKVKLIVLEK